MDNRILYPQPLIKPAQSNPAKPGIQKENRPRANSNDFEKLLQNKVVGREELKFSRHAQERITLRNVKLSSTDLEKINQAVDKAASKGAKESLLLLDNLALVVSINNRTVITAVDGKSIKENIFTNIDSAVIL
jgi:flagellar operon protein